MSTLVRRDLRTQFEQIVDTYFEGRTNRMNLYDIRGVLDIWFSVVDRFR